jgi:hypothetical protein
LRGPEDPPSLVTRRKKFVYWPCTSTRSRLPTIWTLAFPKIGKLPALPMDPEIRISAIVFFLQSQVATVIVKGDERRFVDS